MVPPPPTLTPIYVGSTSPSVFRRAARYDGWEGAVYPWEEVEDHVRSVDDFRIVIDCTEPTPGRMEQMRRWGVTDYLKPPWTAGLRATRTPLAEKLEEMSDFARRCGLAPLR